MTRKAKMYFAGVDPAKGDDVTVGVVAKKTSRGVEVVWMDEIAPVDHHVILNLIYAPVIAELCGPMGRIL